MPATLGIKLEPHAYQGIETELVVNAVGDGSSLFYPQVWWTAAHRKLPILYIVMNNQEYHTLQLGLKQVVAAYGQADGYNWQPQTMDPEYLKIERPYFNFVELAKAFGIANGLEVKQPGDVKAAVREGIDFVLKQKQSFILDVRTAKNTPAPPPAPLPPLEKVLERYMEQPPLDISHQQAPLLAAKKGAIERLPNLPAIF
jgi:benzoylformate decarboxylase